MTQEPHSNNDSSAAGRSERERLTAFTLLTMAAPWLFLAGAVYLSSGNWRIVLMVLVSGTILTALLNWPQKPLERPLSDDELIALENSKRIDSVACIYAIGGSFLGKLIGGGIC